VVATGAAAPDAAALGTLALEVTSFRLPAPRGIRSAIIVVMCAWTSFFAASNALRIAHSYE
jgi:hypothetical protein